jgi:hypothetical protein
LQANSDKILNILIFHKKSKKKFAENFEESLWKKHKKTCGKDFLK